jgi:hypothetical protein
MRFISAFLLCILMLILTTGCGGKDKDEAQKVSAKPDQTVDDKQKQADEKAKEKVKDQKGSFVPPE